MKKMRLVSVLTLIVCAAGGLSACSSKKGGGGTAMSEIVSNGDYTDELRLSPGLVINKMVFGGVNTSGHLIGDYETVQKIVSVDDGGFTFHWAMSYPASIAGNRMVDAVDMKNAHRYSMIFFNHEKGAKAGYTALLVSQDVFNALKSGSKTPFTDDSPKQKPTTLEKIGEETLPLWINDREVTVKTIKAQADNADLYWFLDNTRWPLIVKRQAANGSTFIASLTYPELLTKQSIEELKSKKELATYAVYFAFRSPTLQSESSALLDEVGKFLKENPSAKLAVEVHTDNIDDHAANVDLSQKRAESVKNYLTGQGVAAERISATGLGDSQPIADNATNIGRAKNRRVVLKIN